MGIRIVAAIVALGVPVFATGCGGSAAHGSAAAKADGPASSFIAKADAICVNYNARVEGLPPQGTTVTSAETRLRALVKLAEATEPRLERLTAPSSERGAYARALAADGMTISVMKQELDDLSSGNTTAFNALVAGPQQKYGAAADAAFQKSGLSQCADGTKPQSSPHFAATASAICTAADKQIEALPAPKQTLESNEATASAELVIVGDEITRLGRLTAPPSESAIFRTALSIMHQEVALDRQEIAAARKRDSSTYKKLEAKSQSVGAPLDSFLVRLAVTPCENHVSPEARG